ncbi:MAG: hypothetical protein AAF653_01020, partial [Chloroflexota bacterium]
MKFIRRLSGFIVVLLLIAVLGGGYLLYFTAYELPFELPFDLPFLPEDEMAGESGSILVWTVEGASAPGQQTASQPGRIALIDMGGALSPLMELPEGTSTVMPCGEAAQSPDGRFFAFYAGRDAGSLYLMDGLQPPQAVDEVQRAACMGNGTFAFSPDSTRLAYIDYAAAASGNDFAAGTLKIADAASTTTLFEAERVTAFDVRDERVGYVSFFTDDDGDADEAVITIWDGDTASELAVLRPDEPCAFVSSSVAVLAQDVLSVVLGQQCSRTGQGSWQLYRVDVAAGTAELRDEDDIVGNFQTFGRTNVQFAAPDGSAFAFTAPDGVVANTAGLFAVDTSDFAPRQIIDRQIVMPANTVPANATPHLSPDGRWLAFVQTSPGFENTLVIYDLSDLTQRPTEFSAGSPGDTISALAFTSDSRQLLAVAGGDETANNAIVRFEPGGGEPVVVVRGHYSNHMVAGKDVIAVGDWQFLEDDNEPPYLNLVTASMGGKTFSTLFEGATIQD